jgi:AraC family transcriptional regulator of arabinose operon
MRINSCKYNVWNRFYGIDKFTRRWIILLILEKKYMQHKKEGFKGQQMLVLPKSAKEKIKQNPLINDLYITDIGFYPQAEFHFRERKKGITGNIIMFCVDGSGWFETMGEVHKMDKNSVCIIPCGIPHKYGSDTEKPWTIYWMHIEGKKANLLVGKYPCVIKLAWAPPSASLNRIRVFDEIYSNMEMAYSQKSIEYANMLAWNFLASLLYHDQYNRKSQVRGRNMVDLTVELMHQNLRSNLNLQDFSRKAGLSVSQFSNIFKKHTSASPMNFYLLLKVQKSCQLMENPQRRIKEIALELGFEDQFYFSRLFKKIMGLSPAKFRASLHE